MSRWIVAGAALLAAALAAWVLLRAEAPPHADIDEADRQRLLEILREEDGDTARADPPRGGEEAR